MNRTIIHIIVFITSFSILAYEINFIRIFAFSQWHNLFTLVITMALLGFGASGTVIAVMQGRTKTDVLRWLFPAALFFPLFLCIGFVISSQLDFNPYEIAFSPKQVASFFLYFVLMGIGFFFGAAIICMALIKYRASTVYVANMAGSAAGVVFILGLSFFRHPNDIMVLIILASLIPLCLLAEKGTNNAKMGAALLVVGIAAALSLFFLLLNPKQVSQYKPVSGALNLPGAKLVHEAYSPLGVVQVVAAKGLRSTSGLSLACPYPVPVQKAIFFNGEGTSPISPFSGDPEQVGYVRYQSSYLPFHILSPKHRNLALVVGSGGGQSLLRSILARFKKTHALEMDPNVIDLMKDTFKEFSGDIYNRDNVVVMQKEARHFIRQTQDIYDLIELSMIDAYNAAASGVYALNESYLYTVESFKDYYSKLSSNGLLTVTRWMVTPARDNLKLFNIVIKALDGMGVEAPENHLIAIRSLQTLTLVVSKQEISQGMIMRTRSFAKERFFDLVYCPGISPGEVNQYIRLKAPVYYQGMKKLLSGERKAFIDRYDFDIRAATDNRPFFYNFFKPKVMDLIFAYGTSQVPVTEWGYLLLLIILIPVLLISALCILAPLTLVKEEQGRLSGAGMLYFSFIGCGYFFIQIPMIQKMVLFLGHPVYAISVVTATFLISGSIGAFFSDRIFEPKWRIPAAAVLICLLAGGSISGLDTLLERFIHLETWARFSMAIVVSVPMGFFLGIPFPAGLEIIKVRSGRMVPMAWGVNGFFSVISILCATLCAVIFGFRAALLSALFFYFAAGMVSLRMTRYKE